MYLTCLHQSIRAVVHTTVCLNVVDVDFIDLVLIDLHLLWCFNCLGIVALGLVITLTFKCTVLVYGLQRRDCELHQQCVV